MHILIPVLHRPKNPTGVCRYAANLARCLADTTTVTQVTLIIGVWQKTYFEENFNFISPKIELVDVNIKNNSVVRNIWFLFGLPKLVNQLNPDLVHLSFPFPFIRKWFNCYVVSAVHDLYPYEYPENFGFPNVWFNRLFLSQCIRNSDGISCLSMMTLKALKNYFGNVISTKKTTVTYTYVNFSSIEPKPLKTSLLNQETDFLLTVAQHRKNKNLDLLIKAYKLLIENNTLTLDSRLVIVGSHGPETESILALIQKLSLQNQILLLASISDDELCWLYKFCKLFVISSSIEGMCIPLVEALSFNAKVVCSDIPIFREVGIYSDCQYFGLDSNATKNLSNTIAYALSNNRIDRSDQIDRRFTKSVVAQRYLDFYKALI